MKAFALFSILAASLQARASTQNFSIPTADGRTTIQGQIDYPESSDKKFPAVLMVSGTGLFTRNVYLGTSGTPRDFLFQDLAARFVKAGLAVVRFDDRGVNCDVTSKEKISCIDQNVRALVDDETMLSDIEIVARFAEAQERIDSSRIFGFGHSEGTVNLSRVVKANRVNLKGLLFMGGVAESPAAIIHWQSVGRFVDFAFWLDANHDGVLTNDEVRAGFATSPLAQIAPLDGFLSPTGSWMKPDFTAVLEKGYQLTRQDAIAHKDSDPWNPHGTVFASYKWWKRWFFDETPVLENLKDFAGPIAYHNGDIDTQTYGPRQRDFLASFKTPMKSTPQFTVHAGVGHSLGAPALTAPIDEGIADQLARELQTWAQR